MAATHSLLAQHNPPVTVDTLAHTGYWDTQAGGSMPALADHKDPHVPQRQTA
ncbi:hypothetical protein RKD23_007965 [Streptomyces sp. SAI-170]|uniref:hypothetical protein n=1 Tax=Streptomyces sp. SAI-170 TaxID=3377729 RepID=UPI003C7C093F